MRMCLFLPAVLMSLANLAWVQTEVVPLEAHAPTALVWPQKPKIDPEQRQLLLAASATSTMQMELDEAAAQGFQVVMGTARGNTEMVLLLERTAKAASPYKYKLLATTETGTLQTEIAEAAREGYRVVPRTLMAKAQVMMGSEIVVIMERPPKPEKQYDYLLLATTLTSTFEKEWALAETRGYNLVGLINRVELIALLEREART